MPRGRPRKNTTPDLPGADSPPDMPPPVRGRGKPQVPFPFKLVLSQWLLSLFGVTKFEDLAEHVKREELEGMDENNIHRFHHALTSQLFNNTFLPTEQLLEYDQNIVKHTQRLNDRRLQHGEEPVAWKYFQYLALLFAEVYLDWYFNKPEQLRAALNERIDKYNASKDLPDRLLKFDESEEAALRLNKLAFWMATGSGKTLLMHANILQYLHYAKKKPKSILLLTPNEGLSQQHLREFHAAGMDAELFDKDKPTGGMFQSQPVEIIEVTRLRDDHGEKTVAIESFEGDNLVLVDEGHRGASGGEEGTWMKARNALCEKGFSFEYSATFQQAVSGSPKLIDQYAKCILFNYSYRYFYADGFGKDYQILNLDEKTQTENYDLYLDACLLTFFQQQKLYLEKEASFRPFHIDKPLWIFVRASARHFMIPESL